MSESDAALVFRGYRPGDEDQIVDLFNAVFQKNLTLSEWRWAYQENPAKRLDIVLAFSGSMLIGQSAGIPLAFDHEGNILRASRPQNVMVHPDFRNQGIFSETLKRLTDDCYAKNLDFVLTFPNDNSIGAFVEKSNYNHVFDICEFRLPVNAAPTNNDHRWMIHIQENIDFTKDDVRFISEQLKPFKIFTVRDLNYLNWRYHKNSGKRYAVIRAWDGDRLIGFAVSKFYPEALSIDLVEFIFLRDTATIRAALTTIHRHYKNRGATSFSIWLAEHYPSHQFLADIGFEKTARKTHVVYKTLSPQCSAHCDRADSYYLSMGDSDVY